MNFKGKVVLVTGASAGIGAATAIEFSKNGANVAIVGRNEEKLNEVAEICSKKPLVIKADISKDEECKTIVAAVIKTFGKLDVLVNNAGLMRNGTILEGNLVEVYDEIMNVNLRAHLNVTTLAAPFLIKTKGNIINISSVAASLAPKLKGVTPYCISKAALNHFTRCAAVELASEGVRVNTVSPGPVKTDILDTAGMKDVKVESFADTMPLKRISQSVEIADMILFLASDKAVGVTGAEFVVDNGFMIQ